MLSVSKNAVDKGLEISLLALWFGLAVSSAIVEIATVIALIFFIFSLFHKSTGPFKIDFKQWLPLAAYVLLCAASIIWSEYPKQSLRGSLKVLQQVFIFGAVIYCFRSKKQLGRFEWLTLVYVGIVIFDSLFQYQFGKDLLRGHVLADASAGPRVTGPFKTYGMLASYLIILIPFVVLLGLRLRNFDKRWGIWYYCLAIIPFLIYILLLTRTRGAFLAFIGGLFIFLVYRKMWAGILLSVSAVALLVFILPRSMLVHLDAQNKEQSITERYYLWERAIDVIKAKPWQGTGINTYAAAHAKYDRRKSWRVKNYYAHNGYLQIAAETGVPSLMFFLLFIFSTIHRSFKKLSHLHTPGAWLAPAGALIGTINFLIMAACDTVLHSPLPASTFWYLLGILFAYLRLPETSADH